MSTMNTEHVKRDLEALLVRQRKVLEKHERRKGYLMESFVRELTNLQAKCKHEKTEIGTHEHNLGDELCSICGKTIEKAEGKDA